MNNDKKLDSVKFDCEECAAEIIITTLFKPSFRDMFAVCPYCGFPTMKDIDNVEGQLKALELRMEQLKDESGKVGLFIEDGEIRGVEEVVNG